MEILFKNLEEKVDLDIYLWVLLGHLNHQIEQVRAKELAHHQVTQRQAHILFLIHDLGNNATLSEIAKLAGRKTGSISTQISRMEKKGLLNKFRARPGSIEKRFEMTESGVTVYDFVIKLRSIHKIFSVLSSEDHNQLKLYLENLFKKTQRIHKTMRTIHS